MGHVLAEVRIDADAVRWHGWLLPATHLGAAVGVVVLDGGRSCEDGGEEEEGDEEAGRCRCCEMHFGGFGGCCFEGGLVWVCVCVRARV